MKVKTNTFDEQVGKIGRPFKLTATKKGDNSKWINKVLKSDWYHFFRYTDDGSIFALHEDYNGKIFEKLNHKEAIEKLCTN